MGFAQRRRAMWAHNFVLMLPVCTRCGADDERIHRTGIIRLERSRSALSSTCVRTIGPRLVPTMVRPVTLRPLVVLICPVSLPPSFKAGSIQFAWASTPHGA